MINRRTKALDISKKVKMTVWERDRHRCILCFDCHRRLDQTTERKELLNKVKNYLDRFYPNFTDDMRRYKK